MVSRKSFEISRQNIQPLADAEISVATTVMN